MPDLYVPEDGEIRRALESSLGFFYKVLVEGVLRRVELDGFVKCELSLPRRSKQTFWAYLLEYPEERPVDLEELREAKIELELVPFKYVRKWVATRMLNLEIPEATINFIQGRVPDNVLRGHYLNLLIIADKV